tara:strand:- start:4176 stop:4907 length:732 start_codon:yes stop_codon:yes gene_type:complete
MITFITALFDGEKLRIPHSTKIYDGTWVDKLYRGIQRYYDGNFELVCLVDREYDDIKEPVRQIKFLEMGRGWICIIEKYRPDITWGKRFTLGLDTVITGDLNKICSFEKPMGMISDPLEYNKVCNGITIASKKASNNIWDIWENNKEWVYKNFTMFDNVPSEMLLLRKLFDYNGQCPRLDKIYPNTIVSYKCQYVPYIEKCNFEDVDYLEKIKNISIVYFHGNPKPNDLKNIEINKKILENWI